MRSARVWMMLAGGCLLMEILWGAAFVRPEAVRALLWEEAAIVREVHSGAALRMALRIEEGLEHALDGLALPARGAGDSRRIPGLEPGRAALPEERAFERALAGIFGSSFAESVRLLGLLAAKRLARLLAAIALGAPFMGAMLVDGLFVRRLRAAGLRPPRPSLFGSAGLTLPVLFLGLLPLALLPAAWPWWIAAAAPLVMGLALRSLAANWHRW